MNRPVPPPHIKVTIRKFQKEIQDFNQETDKTSNEFHELAGQYTKVKHIKKALKGYTKSFEIDIVSDEVVIQLTNARKSLHSTCF